MSNARFGPLAGWTVGVAVCAALVGACAAQASSVTSPAAVALSPASGSTSGTPTWSTGAACPSGFQGSAIFRAVKPDGTTFSISQATDSVTAAFHGTLQAPISTIQAVSGLSRGGTQKLEIICYSGPSLTGTSHPSMSTFITYSANGSSYTTSATGTASGPSPSASASSSPGSTASSPGSSTSPTSSASSAPTPTPVDGDLAVTG